MNKTHKARATDQIITHVDPFFWLWYCVLFEQRKLSVQNSILYIKLWKWNAAYMPNTAEELHAWRKQNSQSRWITGHRGSFDISVPGFHKGYHRSKVIHFRLIPVHLPFPETAMVNNKNKVKMWRCWILTAMCYIPQKLWTYTATCWSSHNCPGT